MFEICTANWVLLRPYLKKLRRALRRGSKINQSKFQPKAKYDGEMKLYCRKERSGSPQERKKIDVEVG